jgi:hypothetical protein
VARVVPPLIGLGYGKLIRADRIFALVPLEGPERGDRRRTLVYVDGITDPLVASRSEAAIARDLDLALGSRRGRGARDDSELSSQEPLF